MNSIGSRHKIYLVIPVFNEGEFLNELYGKISTEMVFWDC